MVELVDVNTTNPYIIKYIIRFLRGNTIVVTNGLLKSRNISDIGSISISSEDYINESKNFTH